jgi:hypothetical protein
LHKSYISLYGRKKVEIIYNIINTAADHHRLITLLQPICFVEKIVLREKRKDPMKRRKVNGTSEYIALSPVDETVDSSATTTSTHAELIQYDENISPFTLSGLPLELFIACVLYLSAKDIGRLNLTARGFHQALSYQVTNGISLLERSRDIAQCSAYDESTQTLNFNPTLLGTLLGNKHDLYLLEEDCLPPFHDIIAFLSKYSAWSRSQISTLVFPVEALDQFNITDELNQLAALLTGVRHLRLTLHAKKGILSSFNAEKIHTQLAAFKPIPLEKVTIENGLSLLNMPLSLLNMPDESLWLAVNEGALPSSIKCLAFSDSSNIPSPLPFIISLQENVYPHLQILDCSLAACHRLHLAQLPSTIHCLRIRPITQIQGDVPTIKRLELVYPSNPLTLSEASLPAIEGLPGLEEIDIVSPHNPGYHNAILIDLAKLPPASALSVQLSTLHIYNPALLATVWKQLKGRLSIQKEAIFHIISLQEAGDFIQLAEAGLFDHLRTLRYQLDTLHSSPIAFYQALAALLQNGKLPLLTHFSLTYQYEAPTDPALDGYKTKPSRLYFLDSVAGKLLYATSGSINESALSFQQFLGQEDFTALLDAFISIEPEARAAITRHTYGNIAETLQNTFFTTLRQQFDALLARYHPAPEERGTWAEWMLFMEKMHMWLYNIYLQQLQHQQAFAIPPYLHFLPESFQQTELGQKLVLRTQERMLTGLVTRITDSMQILFSPCGFIGSHTVTPTGFTIHFCKQQSNQEMQSANKSSKLALMRPESILS